MPPIMLGIMFTPNRDRAKLIGFGVHFLNGWIFAGVYAAGFESWCRASWWLGGAIGLVRVHYALSVAMSAMPTMHPRMASEQEGPTPTKHLEPPDFMTIVHDRHTPITVILVHIQYRVVSALGTALRVAAIPHAHINGVDGRLPFGASERMAGQELA
jgi:hypothetical protein